MITKSVRNSLDSELIKLIWDNYDEGYINVKSDGYQYFKIYDEAGSTKLKMWQEFPDVMKIKPIPHAKPCEVWIINDGHVETMLLPEEY